jgi:D-sedoheptulose 7-phosphate isomerase
MQQTKPLMTLPPLESSHDAAFDLNSYYAAQAADHMAVAERTFIALREPMRLWVDRAADVVRAGGKLMFFGNGGSAADAQHIAAELAVKLSADRKPIAALSLTLDSSAMTASGNDYGFDFIFDRQLQAIGRPEDMAIGISTSGKSPNVLKALASARDMGMVTVGLGREGGDQRMPDICDIMLAVPTPPSSARVQEMHITLGHIFCGALEKVLGLV